MNSDSQSIRLVTHKKSPLLNLWQGLILFFLLMSVIFSSALKIKLDIWPWQIDLWQKTAQRFFLPSNATFAETIDKIFSLKVGQAMSWSWSNGQGEDIILRWNQQGLGLEVYLSSQKLWSPVHPQKELWISQLLVGLHSERVFQEKENVELSIEEEKKYFLNPWTITQKINSSDGNTIEHINYSLGELNLNQSGQRWFRKEVLIENSQKSVPVKRSFQLIRDESSILDFWQKEDSEFTLSQMRKDLWQDRVSHTPIQWAYQSPWSYLWRLFQIFKQFDQVGDFTFWQRSEENQFYPLKDIASIQIFKNQKILGSISFDSKIIIDSEDKIFKEKISDFFSREEKDQLAWPHDLLKLSSDTFPLPKILSSEEGVLWTFFIHKKFPQHLDQKNRDTLGDFKIHFYFLNNSEQQVFSQIELADFTTEEQNKIRDWQEKNSGTSLELLSGWWPVSHHIAENLHLLFAE